MTKISSSPERHSFQKKGYVKRMEEKGKAPSEAYLDWFDQVLNEHQHKFDDPASRENNLEYDLLTTEWICEKARTNDAYAQNLYAAMCNMQWQKRDVMPILKNELWSCTWRYAGGIIADMRQEGDYIDWYCSGIRDIDHDEEVNKLWDGRNYVAEGVVTDEIADDLYKLGWVFVPYPEDDKY